MYLVIQLVTWYIDAGTTNCPDLFEEEYRGYLVSVRKGSYRSEFVCLDRTAKQGSQGSSGSLWVPTEFKCGSLPCPPYTQHREVCMSHVKFHYTN